PILRFASNDELHGMHREEENLITRGTEKNETLKVPTAEQLAAYDKDAAAGERLELDNAYYPFMLSVGLFAAHRDDEALEAISRAARCSSWDEHIYDDAEGWYRLSEAAFGRRPALVKGALYAGILFPHLPSLRSAAR